MSYEIRPEYDQVFELPPCLEDWVGPDHPARFIRDYVEMLDLEELGFHHRTAPVGRPNYSSELLLKIWLYGYFNKIRTYRALEAACQENMGLIWLTACIAPDHNTLARFWNDNKKAICKVFRQTVLVAYKAGLIDLALHAVDGTKVMAASSRRTMWDKNRLEKKLKKLNEAIDEILAETAQRAARELGRYRLPDDMIDEKKRKEAILKSIKELIERNEDKPGDPLGSEAPINDNADAVVDDKDRTTASEKPVMDENDSAGLVPAVRTPDKVVRTYPATDEAMPETEETAAHESARSGLPEELVEKVKCREETKKILKALEAAGVERMHPLEPEARLMKNGRNSDLSYNSQAVVDQKHQIIVAQNVVPDENDLYQLVPMVRQVEDILGRAAEETLGDGGYSNPEQFASAEEHHYNVLTKPGSSERPAKSKDGKTVYHATTFTYDQENDRVLCRHGNELSYERTKKASRNKHKLRIYRCRTFRDCPYRDECSRDRRGRMIEIGPHHMAAVRQREKRKTRDSQEKLKARNGIVEPIFAWTKTKLDFTRYTAVGLDHARTQWAMICATINVRKFYKLWLEGKLDLCSQ